MLYVNTRNEIRFPLAIVYLACRYNKARAKEANMPYTCAMNISQGHNGNKQELRLWIARNNCFD